MSSNRDINEGSYHSDSEASSCENEHSGRPVTKAKRPKSLFDILCNNDDALSGQRSPTFLNFAQKPLTARKPHMTNKAQDENDFNQNQPSVQDCKQSAQNASETTRIRVIPLNRLYHENMQHVR